MRRFPTLSKTKQYTARCFRPVLCTMLRFSRPMTWVLSSSTMLKLLLFVISYQLRTIASWQQQWLLSYCHQKTTDCGLRRAQEAKLLKDKILLLLGAPQ